MGLKEQILVGLEGTLNDKTKKYIDKVNALVSTWERLSVFISQSSPDDSENLFSYVHKYTLQLLLHGDWPKLTPVVKTHLVVTLQRCVTLWSKVNVEVAQRCHSIISLVNDPWQHPTLHKILHNLSITDEEVNTFFEVEGSQLLVMRLDVLCEGKCEDLALRLAETCFRYLRNSNISPPSQFNHIRDVLLALLFRFKRNHDIIVQLKQLDLDEGLQLVQRYAKRSTNGARVWKHSEKVTEIAAHTILASAMVQCVEDTRKQQLLYNLIKEWALIHVPKLSSSQQTLQNMVRKIIQTAESSLHIYIFCKVLINEFPDDLKSLCIELYIRGLTANMNEVEQQKIKHDRKKIYDSEIRLSDGFLQLADLLQDNIAVCRECVLTAFSLNPTRSCLDRIKALAVVCRKPDAKSDFKANSNNSKFKPYVDVNDRIEKIDTECELEIKSPSLTDSSNLKNESNTCSRHSHLDSLNDRTLKELCSNCGECVNANSSDSSGVTLSDISYCNNLNFLDPESLGLAQHLCDDLSTVLSSPRYQMLSWSMDWLQLSSKCEKYLEEYDSRRNKITELKYLNIDYSQFKDWPDVEHNISSGIEKGYEQWIDCCDLPEDHELGSPVYECRIASKNQDTSESKNTYGNKAIKSKQEHNKGNLVDELNNLELRSKTNKSNKYLPINHYSENKSSDCNAAEHFGLQPDKERKSRGRKKKTESKTILRLQRKKKKDLLSYTLKEGNCAVPNEVKSLLHKIDGNKNLLNNNNDHEKSFSSLLGLNSSVNNPNILKTLRMYRFPENTKSNKSKNESENTKSAVGPVIDITDIKIRDKFLKSAYFNPKVVLTRPDIKYKINKETGCIKTDKIFDSLKSELSTKPTKVNVKDGKLDILAQAVMSSDILLANSVPGLNSLDMIIPESHEPTVQVVQFPNSATGTAVSQHSVVSVPNDVQPNNSISLNRIKTNSDNMTTQTTELGSTSTAVSNASNTQATSPHSITLLAGSVPQSSVPYLSNSESPVVAAEQRNVSTSANCSNFSSSLIPLTSVHLGTMISRQMSRGSCTTQSSQAQSPTRSTTLKQFPITSTAPVLYKPNQILTVSNQLMNTFVSTTQEGSTQVSAHIQRVGHPVKQTKPAESNTSLKLSSNLVSTQNSKTSEEPLKFYYQTHPTSVFRFIVKDSRIIEEYCPQTCLSDSEVNLLDSDVIAQNSSHGLSEEEMLQLIKRRKEMKPKDEKNTAQGSSLPKFHHVFGRQKYQTIEESNNETKISAQTQFLDATETKKLDNTVSGSSGLSKAVQTALKDNENDKNSDKIKSNDSSGNLVQKSNISAGSNTSKIRSASSNVKTGSDNNFTDSKKVSELQSSPGVIYACNVPVTFGNTTLLQNKPVTIVKTSEPQKVVAQSSAKYEPDTSTKESVIRSNMNALLSAALQSPPVRSTTTVTCTTTTSVTQTSSKISSQVESKEPVETSVHGIQNIRMPIKTIKRQPVVDQGLQRVFKPFVQVSSGTNVSQSCSPVVSCIPLPVRTVQVLATNLNQGGTSSKLENRKESLTLSPVERTPVCSTTLEQLREFESVLEEVTNTSQMKEKSNNKLKTEQEPLLSHTITNNEFSVPPTKQDNVFPSSLENTVTDSNERVSLTFISKPSSNGNSTLINATSPTITTATPVVVVQSCNRPVASSTLITPQSSSSPVPSAVGTNIQSRISNKLNKSKSKSVGKTSPTGSAVKVSTLPKPQQKPQEDEQTTQRIYAILDKYAEQLRNSPELKNKPAPRRRSNPPTSTTQSSKRKKSSQSKIKASTSVACSSGLELSTGSEDLLTLGSEDSSNGLSQISQIMNSPQSRLDEHSTTTGGDVSSETSESLDSKDQRTQHRILLTETSQDTGKAVIVEESLQESTMINVDGSKVLSGKQVVVGNGATIPLTLSLPGTGNVKQVIFPVPADGRQFVVAKVPKMYRVHQVSGSPFLATTSSGTVLFRQMCLNKSNPSVKQMKVPVVSTISSQDLTSSSTNSQPTVVLPSRAQSFTLATNANSDNEPIGLKLDNTVVLNSTTASSISLVQHNLSSSVQPPPGLLATTKTVKTEETSTSGQSVSNDITITCLKSKNMSVCSSGSTGVAGNSEEQPEHCSNQKTATTLSGWSSTVSRSSYSKSWSQILTDVKNRKNGEKITKEELYNKKESIKIIAANNVLKPDFASQKDTRVIWPSDERKNDRETIDKQNDKPAESVIKLNQIDVAGDDSTCKANIIVGSPEFWHCNISRMEILGKNNKSMSPPSLHEIDSKMAEGDSCIVSNSNRRKGNNVENTILQIAFSKSDKTKPVYIKDNIVQQRTLEKELNLQKSLSDECEDLGVDKPSTSDLFPEAELLLEPDPLSRDSLSGGLFSRGVESSSSSHDSPSRSPVLVSRFPASHWKKQKRGVLRRKVAGTENFTCDSGSKKPLCTVKEPKPASSSGSVSCNSNSVTPQFSITSDSEKVIELNSINRFKRAKNQHMEESCNNNLDDSDIHCNSRDTEIDYNDSDNENCVCSGDDNYNETDMQDTADSDSAVLQQTCSSKGLHDISGSEDSLLKDSVAKLENHLIEAVPHNFFPPSITCNKRSILKFSDFMPMSLQKNKLNTDLSWNKIVEGVNNKTNVGSDLSDVVVLSEVLCKTGDSTEENVMGEETGSDVNTSNGDMQAFDETSNTSKTTLHTSGAIVGSTSGRKRKSHSPQKGNKSARTRKGKKINMLSLSSCEESDSSIDTVVSDNETCQAMHTATRRASARGHIKKGCPCLNGSPEPSKKKKELGLISKTDKLLSSNSLLAVITNKKTVNKCGFRNVLKKR